MERWNGGTRGDARDRSVRVPVTNGAVGKVPAYTLVDANTSYTFSHVRLQPGASNVFDRSYFTKRPTFYPGPGVWPSDGRTFQLSTTLKF